MILVRIETEKISPVIPESPVTRTKKYEIVWKTFLINTKQIYIRIYIHMKLYTRSNENYFLLRGKYAKKPICKVKQISIGKRKEREREKRKTDTEFISDRMK